VSFGRCKFFHHILILTANSLRKLDCLILWASHRAFEFFLRELSELGG
jgi:hypothetical protein